LPTPPDDPLPEPVAASQQKNLLSVLDATQAMLRELDGTIRFWTSGAERLYGWTSSEAVGRVSHELLQTAFPRPLHDIHAELIAQGHWQGELMHRTRDGRSLHVATHWVLQRDEAGQPSGLVETNSDITESLQADAAMRRLAAIVESSSDAIIGKDLKGIVTSWNGAAEKMFGYTAGEIIGNPILLLFPPDRVHEENDIIGRIRSGGMLDHYETVRMRKGGATFPASVSVASIRDQACSIVGASKIVRDLTEQKEREQHLREVQAQLFHAQRLTELGQLVSTLVHEVNQPLTAITNYTGAGLRLLDAGNARSATMALQKIGEQAERANQIIARLRNFVRGGATDRRPEDLGGVIDEAVALASSSLKSTDVRLRTRLHSVADKVSADRVQIQQVLFNLVRNAAEAMQQSPRREVLVATAPNSDDLIEISVADTGPGLPPEIRAHLFQPFFTTKGNGMGIGLSVCRSIVEAHGGQLWADDNPTGGTVFHFTLPRPSAVAT
jgi:two-component system sensor kinase FixL